jgi:hypothetical protein
LLRAKPFHVSSCMIEPMFRDFADDANREVKYGEAVVVLHAV